MTDSTEWCKKCGDVVRAGFRKYAELYRQGDWENFVRPEMVPGGFAELCGTGGRHVDWIPVDSCLFDIDIHLVRTVRWVRNSRPDRLNAFESEEGVIAEGIRRADLGVGDVVDGATVFTVRAEVYQANRERLRAMTWGELLEQLHESPPYLITRAMYLISVLVNADCWEHIPRLLSAFHGRLNQIRSGEVEHSETEDGLRTYEWYARVVELWIQARDRSDRKIAEQTLNAYYHCQWNEWNAEDGACAGGPMGDEVWMPALLLEFGLVPKEDFDRLCSYFKYSMVQSHKVLEYILANDIKQVPLDTSSLPTPEEIAEIRKKFEKY